MHVRVGGDADFFFRPPPPKKKNSFAHYATAGYCYVPIFCSHNFKFCPPPPPKEILDLRPCSPSSSSSSSSTASSRSSDGHHFLICCCCSPPLSPSSSSISLRLFPFPSLPSNRFPFSGSILLRQEMHPRRTL